MSFSLPRVLKPPTQSVQTIFLLLQKLRVNTIYPSTSSLTQSKSLEKYLENYLLPYRLKLHHVNASSVTLNQKLNYNYQFIYLLASIYYSIACILCTNLSLTIFYCSTLVHPSPYLSYLLLIHVVSQSIKFNRAL